MSVQGHRMSFNCVETGDVSSSGMSGGAGCLRGPRRCCVSAVMAAMAFLSQFASPTVSGQPVEFGSADDPLETSIASPWRATAALQLMGGFSLIGAQWRTAAHVAAEVHTASLSARGEKTLRAGIYGAYDPDLDDAYDLLRAIEYVRFSPAQTNVYVRAGPTSRLRLGTGHIVNFFNTKAVWDDRTMALEGTASGRAVTLQAFADNVLIDGVVGTRASVNPLFWARESKARSLEIGATYVTDMRRSGDRRLITAFGVDLQFVAATIGDILVQPFTTFSRYHRGGTGMGVGADLSSDNFVDVARFRLRLAVYYSGDGFVPGFVGPFYSVNNPGARILKSEDLVSGDSLGAVTGTPLSVASGGTSVETELRLLFFKNFELWYNFRRHFGGAPLSEYHIRLFFRTGRITAYVGQDRAGLKSFFTLFNDLGDLTWMEFRTDYHISGDAWIFVRAVYSFEEVRPTDDGSQRFLVQRRFEPFTGFRLRF